MLGAFASAAARAEELASGNPWRAARIVGLSALRIRQAARAVVLDPDGRILLVRFEFPNRSFWATPGGGVDSGETHEATVRRELEEETGLVAAQVGPPLWSRLHVTPFIGGQWDGQQELYYLVRTPAFVPRPRQSWEQLNAEYVFEVRWWTLSELARANVTFSPGRLPELVSSLLREGPLGKVIDVGV